MSSLARNIRRSSFCLLALSALLTALAAQPVAGQIIKTDAALTATDVRYGTPVATRYRVGAKVTAKGAAASNVRLMVAVPLECPEQEVHLVEEDYSPHVAGVDFRLLPPADGARQMLISVPNLPARQEAYAYITYEVLTKPILPPEETASLRIPKKIDRDLKPYLSASPFIDTGHRKIREAVREALAAKVEPTAADALADEAAEEEGKASATTESAYEDVPTESNTIANTPENKTDEKDASSAGAKSPTAEPIIIESASASADGERTDWERIEALYDYVLARVKYQEGDDKSSVQALQDGVGDCQAISALFVAMCRSEKVPARMMWVDGHQYAEFYLENEAGQGRWYPVESAGTRAFGEMPLARVILQKGDNFRVPERRGERLRYASDYALFLSPPAHKPRVAYVREKL
jgi:transglutaminase-like putative cysteine protease